MRQRVLFGALEAGGEPEQVRPGEPAERLHGDEPRLSLGERAGLVDEERVGLLHRLERFGTADEDARGSRPRPIQGCGLAAAVGESTERASALPSESGARPLVAPDHAQEKRAVQHATPCVGPSTCRRLEVRAAPTGALAAPILVRSRLPDRKNVALLHALLAQELQEARSAIALHRWLRRAALSATPMVGLAGCGRGCDRPDSILPARIDGGVTWQVGSRHSAAECAQYCGAGRDDPC